jgi:hypothetical protein
VVPQHTRLRIVQRDRGDVCAAEPAQRGSHGGEQRTRVELRDDGVGDIEQQFELIALALQRDHQIINLCTNDGNKPPE